MKAVAVVIVSDREVSVFRGSVEALAELIAHGDCNGDFSELCNAFPDRVYCRQMKQAIPLILASALTPFHTKCMSLDGHAVCEVDCGRACQSVSAINTNTKVVSAAEALSFKISANEELLTVQERAGMGLPVASSAVGFQF